MAEKKNWNLAEASQQQMHEVAKVFKASIRNALPNLPMQHTEEEDINFFSNVVFPASKLFVANTTDCGRILGFIAFDSNWIKHLYVLPEIQRRGIGNALLEKAISQSSTLQLWTFQMNTAAQRFYEKHGFAEIKRTDGQDNEEKTPDILYKWTRSDK